MPVDSEFANSQHIAGNASASSSIFLSCRKHQGENKIPSVWSGFGGTGVAMKIREAVREGLKEFAPLKLNPVDEMVASYGRALQVLSEHWPVLDGDELVSPTRAMNEASAVVAQYQVAKITNNRLNVDHLHHETAMALTLYGIYGLSEFPFDDALNLSRSLNISLEMKSGGYTVSDRMIGINLETSSSRARHHKADHLGYPAPLLRRGSKLRLTLPEERDMDRVERPQTEWDILHGLILKYREGDVPVARAYLTQHAGEKEQVIYDLLEVWASEMPDESLRKEAELLRYGLKG
jgi:adenine-specific DNA methylase